MDVLKIFTIICVIGSCILWTYLTNVTASCKPISTEDFAQCVRSCAVSTDETKFENRTKVIEYCVEQCTVLLKECEYDTL